MSDVQKQLDWRGTGMEFYTPHYDYVQSGTVWPACNSNDATSPPEKAQADGYCLDCERETTVEHYQLWAGTCEQPRTCLDCGSHRAYLLDELSRHLLERAKKYRDLWVDELRERILVKHAETWARLAAS